MDHFPTSYLEFLNQTLHRLEVINMQLCPCVHHTKFREMTQYDSNSIMPFIHMLKTNRKTDETPLRIRLGGPRKQFLLKQLWDCETSGRKIGMYIPEKLSKAAQGSSVVNMLQRMSEYQGGVAKLY